MIQTKCTPGQCWRSQAIVSKVKCVPIRASMPADVDARMASKRARRLDTRRERRQTMRILQRIAGTDEPPDAIEIEPAQGDEARGAMALMRRIETAAEEADLEPRRKGRQIVGAATVTQRSRPDLTRAMHAIFERGQLLEADGPARVHPPRRDADLGAEAEFAAVGELRRRIVQHDRRNRPRAGSAPPSPHFRVTMQSV